MSKLASKLSSSQTQFGPGTEIYWDCFAGMLKGTLLKIEKGTIDEVEIRITTKTNRVYHVGEVVRTSAIHVFPRCKYHKTGVNTYRVSPYEWIVPETT